MGSNVCLSVFIRVVSSQVLALRASAALADGAEKEEEEAVPGGVLQGWRSGHENAVTETRN